MGKTMSVEMTNCGDVGWVSDKSGYRYEKVDPLTGCAWPVMPTCFGEVAQACALQAGYEEFHPDACLINRYSAGSKMGLHQDRDERDFSQPIVSVSLGLPIIFVFGGTVRTATKSRCSSNMVMLLCSVVSHASLSTVSTRCDPENTRQQATIDST